MKPHASSILNTIFPPLLVFLIFIGMWQIFVTAFEIPRFLIPSPVAVAQSLALNGRQLLQATSLTALAALIGFLSSLVFGTLIAFVFSQSSFIQRSFYPYAIFLQTVPIVAIAPLIIIWFGTGFQSVVIVSFMISLFPIITNATTGLTRTNRNLDDLFKLYNATRLQKLLMLQLPSAAPYIVTGAKISSGLSVIGAIVGEFFAGYGTNVYGLGYLIIQTSGQLNTPYLFGAIFVSTFLGVAIFGLVSFVSDALFVRWQKSA